MPLLGLPLLLLLGALGVALPILTLLLWNRLRGSASALVLARVSLLGLGQVATLLFVGALLNNSGYFYSSWSELLGMTSAHAGVARPTPTPSVRTQPRPPATLQDSAPLTVLTDPGWSTKDTWSTRGRLQSVTITGSRSQLASHAFVYLPPQYFQPKYAHHRFPAVEVFTGFPGHDIGLVKGMKYPDRLLAEIDRHQAKPMVLVMMRPSVTFPRDTECTDVPGGPQAFTFFSADVPTAVGHGFRVLPTGWGAMGDSTGGYCAAKLAMTNSYVFPAAVALSGYFHTLKDNTTGDLWAGSRVVRNLNDLEWRLGHLPAPPVSLLLTSSRDEGGPNGYVDTRALVNLARPPMKVDELVLDHGGHNFEIWKLQLPRSLDWLSHKLPPAHP